MHPVAATSLAFAAAFVSGALPFSVWIGRAAARTDIRSVADGNPGSMNVFRAAGPVPGVIALTLDVTKGVLPMLLAAGPLGLTGWRLAVAAILPVAGHAFSPFLRFRGGKALAVMLGVWIGLTVWKVPLVAVASVTLARWVLRDDARAVLVALAAMELSAILWLQDGWLSLALFVQAAIIIWMHRAALCRRDAAPRRSAAGAR